MSTFFAVLGGIILFVFFIASFAVPIVIWMGGPDLSWKTPLKTKLAATAGGILLLAVVLTIFIGLVNASIGPDNSSHCGAGTRYISETHRNVKTTITVWECVAA